MIKKWQLNFIIDIVLFIVLALLIGLGFLIKYVLLSGVQSYEVYGSNYTFTWLGLTRHQWGTIHLFLGLAFFVLIILHIVLHWKAIKTMLCCLVPTRQARIMLIIIIVAISLLCAMFWVAVQPQATEGGLGGGRGQRALDD